MGEGLEAPRTGERGLLAGGRGTPVRSAGWYDCDGTVPCWIPNCGCDSRGAGALDVDDVEGKTVAMTS